MSVCQARVASCRLKARIGVGKIESGQLTDALEPVFNVLRCIESAVAVAS